MKYEDNPKNLKFVLKLDPRTKLFMLLLCVIAANSAPSLEYVFFLNVVIGIMGVVCGGTRLVLKGLLFYAVMYILTMQISFMTGTLRTTFLAFFGLFHKVYPCGMMGAFIITTTQVNEFLSAMNRLHAPKKIIIPFAVMIRYFPAIREDWHYIKDAMKMRDISPSFLGFIKHPIETVDCIYVPLLTAASKTADELSVAAITRGIENPQQRTCLITIRFGIADGITASIFVLYMAAAFIIGR